MRNKTPPLPSLQATLTAWNFVVLWPMAGVVLFFEFLILYSRPPRDLLTTRFYTMAQSCKLVLCLSHLSVMWPRVLYLKGAADSP